MLRRARLLSARHLRGLRAFFAKTRLKRADVEHIRLGTKLMQAEEAASDVKVLDTFLHGNIAPKTDSNFMKHHAANLTIGPRYQRKRVAKRVRDLRKSVGPKEARKVLKNIAIRFKKTRRYRHFTADDIDDLTSTKPGRRK